MQKISKNFGNITYLTITGGEPFLRTDLDKIVKLFIKNNNIDFISIPTNGSIPNIIIKQTENMLKSCPDTAFRIALSIDAIGKEHDKLRRLPGLFNNILKTYKGLAILRKKYRNLNIDVCTTYSKYTEKKVFKILDYVKKNMKIDNHVLNLARGDVKDPIIKDIKIDRYAKAIKEVEITTAKTKINRKDFRLKLLKAVKLVMREIILKTLKENKMVLPCVAGDKFVIINEKGEVYPCDIFINHKEQLLGSLRQHNYNIKKVLRTKQARKIIKWIKRTRCYCTFECGIQNNIIFSPKAYWMTLKKLVKVK